MSVNLFSEAVSAVSPFKIPHEMEEDFLEDYVKIVRDMQLIDHVNNNINHINIRTNYHLLVVYGKK